MLEKIKCHNTQIKKKLGEKYKYSGNLFSIVDLKLKELQICLYMAYVFWVYIHKCMGVCEHIHEHRG